MTIALCLFTAFLVFMAITSYRRRRATTAWLIKQAEQQRERDELYQRMAQINQDTREFQDALAARKSQYAELAAEHEHLSAQLGIDPVMDSLDALPCLRLVTNDDELDN